MDLGQRGVARVLEPALHVAERVLVGHQLDEALAAVGVQGEDLLAGQRRGFGPHFGVVAVGKGVLGVKLKLVDLPAGQAVDQVEQGFHLGDFVAADIQHHAARGEIRPVGDLQAGQLADPWPAG